jgi:hypothetical protein
MRSGIEPSRFANNVEIKQARTASASTDFARDGRRMRQDFKKLAQAHIA